MSLSSIDPMLSRLLIVDDNAAMRRFIRSLVADLAIEIREAEDGSDAVAQYASWHPDAVLMDIRMPVMDGIEATRSIRTLDPQAAVIMVTDYDLDSYRTDARDAGASDYVVKEDMLLLPAAIRNVTRDRS